MSIDLNLSAPALTIKMVEQATLIVVSNDGNSNYMQLLMWLSTL